MGWEFGVSRYKLLYIGWMNNKVLLYSTGNYIQYPVTSHNGKEYEKECIVVLMVKNPPANAGDIRDAGLIPGSGRSLEEGNGNSLQYSCMENIMDKGARHATFHWVTKSWTQLQ